jgi:hypothetical protein
MFVAWTTSTSPHCRSRPTTKSIDSAAVELKGWMRPSESGLSPIVVSRLAARPEGSQHIALSASGDTPLCRSFVNISMLSGEMRSGTRQGAEHHRLIRGDELGANVRRPFENSGSTDVELLQCISSSIGATLTSDCSEHIVGPVNCVVPKFNVNIRRVLENSLIHQVRLLCAASYFAGSARSDRSSSN